MSQIQEKLEEGVKQIYTSEKYKDYIRAMSKFPSYSVNNCILIASQYPQASLVCGYHKWQTDFKRNVNKGEHGIMIIAPIRGKCKVEEELFDENNHLIRDEDGNPMTELVTKEYEDQRKMYNLQYYGLFAAQNSGEVKITGITFWGTIDKYSWLQFRSNVGGGNKTGASQCPLLFDNNYEPKPCFYVFAKTD